MIRAVTEGMALVFLSFLPHRFGGGGESEGAMMGSVG